MRFSFFCIFAPAMSVPNKLIEKIEGFTRKYYLNRLIQGVLVGAVLWIVFYLLINGLEYFSWFPPKGRCWQRFCFGVPFPHSAFQSHSLPKEDVGGTGFGDDWQVLSGD